MKDWVRVLAVAMFLALAFFTMIIWAWIIVLWAWEL